MVGAIIRAQAELRNRLVQVEWKNADGGILKVIIDPRRPSTIQEKQRLPSAVVNRITRLTVLEILPF